MKKTTEQVRQNSSYGFATVKLKRRTAERFRDYSRKIASSHSQAMDLILDFFKHNRVSPSEDLGPNMRSLENSLKKRINTVIAIIPDIERTQTKPALAMLQLLFQESPPKKEVVLDRFYGVAEKTFDRLFDYKRNYAESNQGRKVFNKDPKQYYSHLQHLSPAKKRTALMILKQTDPNITPGQVSFALGIAVRSSSTGY